MGRAGEQAPGSGGGCDRERAVRPDGMMEPGLAWSARGCGWIGCPCQPKEPERAAALGVGRRRVGGWRHLQEVVRAEVAHPGRAEPRSAGGGGARAPGAAHGPPNLTLALLRKEMVRRSAG